MTNRERFLAILNGQKADRGPVFPLLMFLAADRAGINYRQYATNGRALAQAQLLVQGPFFFTIPQSIGHLLHSVLSCLP